jgi:hypothetical protein
MDSTHIVWACEHRPRADLPSSTTSVEFAFATPCAVLCLIVCHSMCSAGGVLLCRVVPLQRCHSSANALVLCVRVNTNAKEPASGEHGGGGGCTTDRMSATPGSYTRGTTLMGGALTPNWPPLVPCPNFAGAFSEQKRSHNRGIRRGQKGEQGVL